ncbi:hypothetical protein P9112_006899 [Eukaryota sp. TZLM1-RC]
MSAFKDKLLSIDPSIDTPIADYVSSIAEDFLDDPQTLAETIHPILEAWEAFGSPDSTLSTVTSILNSLSLNSNSHSDSNSSSDSDSDSEGEFLADTPAALELTTKADFFEQEKARLRAKTASRQPSQPLNSVCSSFSGTALTVSYPPNGIKSSPDGSFCVEDFSLTFGANELLHDATLSVAKNAIYGLVGRNGSGKSTLFNAIASGKFKLHPSLKVFLVRQDADVEPEPAIIAVLKSHLDSELGQNLADYVSYKEQLNQSNQISDDQFSKIECYLIDRDALHLVDDAKEILKGLGFENEKPDTNSDTNSTPSPYTMCTSLSGGYRMRVSLAAALFSKYPIILLDEPTSHLSMNSIVWLERCLQRSVSDKLTFKEARKPRFEDSTILLVSHDVTFLNAVCTNIIHLDSNSKKLRTYKGNYSEFVSIRNQQLLNQQRLFEAQQRHRQHMQAFVDRWRCNAKKASMAQSRLKKLEKMSLIDPVQADQDFTFEFPEAAVSADSGHLVEMKDVYFKYSDDGPLILDGVDFVVPKGSKIALIGENGSGKSTMAKIISGILEPSSGEFISRSTPENTAVYHQHFADQLEFDQTPTEYIQAQHPSVDELTIRKHLGSFGITGDMAVRPIGTFSGGEKARITLSSITLNKNPRLLLLDELTNYLDMVTMSSLIHCLSEYDGTIIAVSHNRHFLEYCCTDLWVCKEGKVVPFEGSIHDYCKTLG